jgi:acyl-CoA synthetase (AMP-forming)/AMP-acid ligase II
MSVLALDQVAADRAGGDTAAKAWLRALAATAPIAAQPERTLAALIEELADTFGDAPALLSDRESMTYRELAARANRYARWALELGVAHGDTVCLMMPNRPEYLAIWLGVTRIGGIVSLLNTSLTGAALAHYNTDGRAGMAALVVDQRFDLAQLRLHLAERLPDYARPLFLRILPEMEVTGTFKHKKSDLARAGYDPSLSDDAIYFNDAETGAFVRLDQALFRRIQSGKMRV